MRFDLQPPTRLSTTSFFFGHETGARGRNEGLAQPEVELEELSTAYGHRGSYLTRMRAEEEDEFHDSLLDEERLRGSSERSLRRSRGGEGDGGGGIFSSMQRGLRKRFCPGPSEEGDRDLRPGHAAHHFTFSEKERMNEYESLDYNVPHSQIYRKYLQQKTKWWYIRKDLSKWLLFCVVGAAVGFVAFLLKQTTELIAEGHFKVTELILDTQDDLNKALVYPLAWLAFVGYSLITVLCASALVVYWQPPAGGSGIPDVMGYLNGVNLPKIFNVRTLVVKFTSCVLAISSGLPVGPEGPMIHMGAMVGGNLTQGRSRTLNWNPSFLTRFRNTQDRRDFITGGAAAGVSAAFGAPIGGLLFVREEVASFWNHKLTYMIFVGCLMASFAASLLNSSFIAWVPTGRFGYFIEESTILFPVNQYIEMHIFTMVPSIVIGICGGVMGTVFTYLNLKITRFRNRFFVPYKLMRLLEPCIVVAIFSSLCLFLPLAFPCLPKPENPIDSDKYRLVKHACDNEGEYSPLATLMFNVGDEAIRHLFSRGTAYRFSYSSLAVFLVIYFFFACYSSGMAISSGIVLPMLVIGATLGRIVGLATIDYLGISASWMDPGVFALIGAASFFAGVSRLTIALAVIVTELSNDIHFLLPIMLAVMIAKSIADTATHSLYHALLEVRCVPFLENDPVVRGVDTFKAKDVMSAPVTTFRHKEKVRNIVQTLISCRHHAFPVVLTPKDKVMLDSRNKIRKQGHQEKLARTHRLTPSSPMASPSSAFAPPRRVDSQLEGFDMTEIEVNIKQKEKEDDGHLVNNGRGERLSGLSLGLSGSMTIDDLIEDTDGVRMKTLDLEGNEGALALRQRGRGLLDGGLGSPHRRRYEEDEYEDDKQHAAFKGMILRAQLEILLRHPEIFVANEYDINPVLDYRRMKDEDTSHKSPISITSPRYLETVQEEDMDKYIDLSPYINTSSLTVTENFSLGFTYNLFRSMGLRHLPVVNENNQPVGIITRKDLLGQTLEERLLVAKGGMPQPRTCVGCFGGC